MGCRLNRTFHSNRYVSYTSRVDIGYEGARTAGAEASERRRADASFIVVVVPALQERRSLLLV
jgi:hypothetical protein